MSTQRNLDEPYKLTAPTVDNTIDCRRCDRTLSRRAEALVDESGCLFCRNQEEQS